MNELADALSQMYSDEPKGIVRAASEYVTAEEENAPSELILNMVSAPLYTGESIFLGAVCSKARRAFPNARKVVLKVQEPSKQLEGVSVPENFENVENQQDTEKTIMGPIISPSLAGNSTDISVSSSENGKENISSMSFLLEASDAPAPDDNVAADELLSETPITLTDVLESGDPTLDIHSRIAGRYSDDPFFDIILKNPWDHKNFKVSNDLVFMKDKDRCILCIPDIKVGQHRLRKIEYFTLTHTFPWTP
jgi:hypothetical protein